jgi:hypothetical protein
MFVRVVTFDCKATASRNGTACARTYQQKMQAVLVHIS